jgi:hypothetical protein
LAAIVNVKRNYGTDGINGINGKDPLVSVYSVYSVCSVVSLHIHDCCRADRKMAPVRIHVRVKIRMYIRTAKQELEQRRLS